MRSLFELPDRHASRCFGNLSLTDCSGWCWCEGVVSCRCRLLPMLLFGVGVVGVIVSGIVSVMVSVCVSVGVVGVCLSTVSVSVLSVSVSLSLSLSLVPVSVMAFALVGVGVTPSLWVTE